MEQVNGAVGGWVNYFRVGNSSRAFSEVREYLEMKIGTLLTRRKRRKKTSIGWRRWSNEYLYDVLKLYWDWKIYPLQGLGKRESSQEEKNSYWQDFCVEIKNIKTNFKNCLLVIGRSLEKLLLPMNNENAGCLPKILKSISRVRQKIRPGRHTPRQSRKPINKWSSSNGGKVLYA